MADQFELISQLGRGGMGVVWKARDTATGEIVALKLLHDLYAGDAEYVARFEREVELGRRVDSPNVVKVLGFGRREGVPFLAMQYVDGPSLKEKLKEHGPYTWAEAKPLLLQVAQGLEASHAAGIVHRDVKPSNILLAPDGTAKLADFGIARAADLTGLTATNVMMGTTMYMAPEGQRDARSDLYGLGCVAYEMATGGPPLQDGDRDDPEGLRRIPEDSARKVVAWLMAAKPEQRPQSAAALIAVLEGSSRVPSIRKSRVSTPVLVAAVPAVLAIAAIVGVVFALTRNTGHSPAGVTPVPASSTPTSATPTAISTQTATATSSATATAPAPPTPAVVIQSTRFKSPTGNILCILRSASESSPAQAACLVVNTTFEAPPNPDAPGCGLGTWGHAFQIPAGGEASMICAGEQWNGPDMPVLEYGQTTTAGPIACTSSITDMRCTDLDTGHGFKIAREAYELF